MSFTDISLLALAPVLILIVSGMVIMVADPFIARERRHATGWIGVVGTFLAGAALIPAAGTAGTWYSGIWRVDAYSIFFDGLLLLVAGLTILISLDYVRRETVPPSEFVVLVLFATSGALLMSGAGELILVFVGIEILSMATYVLAGYRRQELRSNESALKYFLLGSFASAFLLYGIALIFGATGSTNLIVIGERIQNRGVPMELVSMACALMIVGLAFKVALTPFHVWTPDVYEGAPTPVTGFMSTAPKAAGFAVLLRILLTAFPGIGNRWVWVMWALAAATMLIGNIVAIVQPSIKRMLAYSSIAHAGYVAVAVASATDRSVAAALFYLLAYSVANLGAFAIVTRIADRGDRRVAIRDYRGFGWSKPGAAAMLSLFLLSLAGVPTTGGFAGKLFIFRSAVESGLTGLAIIGVLTTVVSFYYYLHVIVEMYMHEAESSFDDIRLPPATIVVVVVAGLLTLYFGILPGGLLDWAGESASSLLALL